MGKYRHVVSGRVVERDDAYALRSKAFEPVDENTTLSEAPCIPCGPTNTSAGVEEEDWGYEEEPTVSVEGE